ncbi:HAMP domain-containing histidine kinase, partial [archaeon]
MLMTINRCIDYTKASKGLRLVPKYETIDLLDTLSLPLNCMKDIQNRISIQLLPLPSSICSHVITDKQWLQENVLCLLSNAVKYSSEGEVLVKV